MVHGITVLVHPRRPPRNPRRPLTAPLPGNHRQLLLGLLPLPQSGALAPLAGPAPPVRGLPAHRPAPGLLLPAPPLVQL